MKASDKPAVASALGVGIAKPLGSGSYGDTYLVPLPDLGGDCAVKLLKPDTYDARRAERETEGMRRFTGSGVAELRDVRTVQLDGTDRVALICEFIPGGDVHSRLLDGELPNHKHLRKFATSLLSTVAELHAADTVHRDIKPLNILLRDGKWGRPVLIDFGLSRLISDPTITGYGAFTGSYAYMPPEHLRGEPARKLADLWAVGVTLFQLATGKHPFLPDQPESMTVDDLLLRLSGTPGPLPHDFPDDLRALIERLLSETPHRRGSAARAVKDLTESER